MRKEFLPQRLDVMAFAEQGAELAGADTGLIALKQYGRLAQDVPDIAPGEADAIAVAWRARGERLEAVGGAAQNWLHLEADSHVLQTCQRCLQPVAVPVAFVRSYRFVADEATAEREDVDAEEDLLVASRQFDLLELIEDELLMELPQVPRHAQCPVELPMAVETPDFSQSVEPGIPGAETGKPNPFAVLASLKIPPG
jgi:uncharacterized protein